MHGDYSRPCRTPYGSVIEPHNQSKGTFDKGVKPTLDSTRLLFGWVGRTKVSDCILKKTVLRWG
jgi:hypothetical protein